MQFKKLELTPSVSILIAGVIIAGAIIYANGHTVAPAAAPAAGAVAQGTATPVPPPSAADHIIGSLSAPIVLIEYSDFQCPFCQLIHPSLQKAVADGNGKVAWIMREFPLYQIHPNALPGANAAECIADQLGNTGFWKFADTVFADQTKIGPSYFADIAKSLGADMTKYNSCISSNKFADKITKQTAEAQAAGGNGTPYTVVVNTKTGKEYPVSGAVPYAQLAAVIKQAQESQ